MLNRCYRTAHYLLLNFCPRTLDWIRRVLYLKSKPTVYEHMLFVDRVQVNELCCKNGIATSYNTVENILKAVNPPDCEELLEALASYDETASMFRAGRFICLARLSLNNKADNWVNIIDFGKDDEYARMYAQTLGETLATKFYNLYEETLTLPDSEDSFELADK